MRVVVVGPVAPCRGGTSYYTTELCRRLGLKHQVTAYSMERLYTSFIFSLLFKGENVSDSSKQQASIGVEKRNTISVNPFSWIKAAAKIRQAGPDVVIITWIDPYMFPLVKAIEWFMPKHSKLVFICHRVLPIDKRLFARQLTQFCFKRADGFITHSAAETKDLLELRPDASYAETYLPAYTLKHEVKSIKKQLNLREHVLLFFGYVRPNKGLRYLLRSLPKILEKVDVDLLIVGEFWEDKSEYVALIDALGISDHVKIIGEYVPNEEIGNYFACADVAVLPYESVNQSAVVQIAYAHDTPVIATKVGGLADTVFDGETGFLVEPKNERALADVIVRFYKENMRESLVKNVKSLRQNFSWDKYMSLVESFFK